MTVPDWFGLFCGSCDTCGHPLKKIARVHVSDQYPSGLMLVPTHWDITEVDEDEPTGIGCTECEKDDLNVYCVINEGELV